jgi:hypothetical protein
MISVNKLGNTFTMNQTSFRPMRQEIDELWKVESNAMLKR